MFNPNEANSEFIEIFNISEIEAIDISNYTILYHTSSSADSLIFENSEIILKPKQYAIILEGDYDFENGIYKKIIPTTALILTIKDNSFGTRGMANSSNRSVFLLDENNDTLDVYEYTANNKKGISDERLIPTNNTWENSIVTNGTPGFKNSTSPKENDIDLLSFSTKNKIKTIGNNFLFSIKVKNVGTKLARNIKLNIYKDRNFDGIPQPEEIQVTKTIEEIDIDNSLTILQEVVNNTIGKNVFIAEVQYEKDEYKDNNVKSVSVFGVAKNELRGNLIINEIMYAPKSPEPEWIEIFNKSEKTISLKNFQIADSKDTIKSITGSIQIEPKGFLVVAKDSSIISTYPSLQNFIIENLPTLNNSEDKILILDSLSRIIDSVYYSSKWGGKTGKSLERIHSQNSSDSSNWNESLTYSTPGKINSVTQKNYDVKIENVFSTPLVPIYNDAIKLNVNIKNIGKKTLEFKIALFSDTNIDSIKENKIETSNPILINAGDSINYQFNYQDTIKLRKGYIFEITTLDDDVSNNVFYYSVVPGYPAKSILINEIKFSPKNDEPEWIELFNNSEFNIDLKNWSIGDVLTTPVFKKITEDQYLFPSKTYLVISKSRDIFNFYQTIPCTVIELNFANLNNDKDGIVIKDNRLATIDSVLYTNKIGGKSGESIERVLLEFSSTNFSNWKQSVNVENGTPGRINSVTPKNYDLTISSISTIPKFPVKNDKLKIEVKIFNKGNFDVENFNLTFFYGQQTPNKKLDDIYNLSLLRDDSLIIHSTNKFIISDTTYIAAKIELSKDEDKTNNYIDNIATAGFNQNSVLINEVMFNPKEGKPIWIELINNSDSTINISGWHIGDLQNKNIIVDTDIFIEPNEFLVISNIFQENVFPEDVKVIQTHLPKFSSKKDAVVIYDFRNATIDSMFYAFHTKLNKGISLERISKTDYTTSTSNWIFSLSDSGSTPGQGNSMNNIPTYNFGDIIINEIMFEPDSTNSEFIELYNNSQNPIELGGCRIVDKDGKGFTILDFSKTIQPKDFFLVSADSAILGNYNWLEEKNNLVIKNLPSLELTNNNKLLFLKDFKGNIIDSLHYSKNWHNSNFIVTKNISLELLNYNSERNSSSNWSSCVGEEGATPGKQNSIYVKKIVGESQLNILPNPFSPDNDGFEDFTFISYKLTQPIAQIRLKIFDSKGRLVRILANNKPSASNGSITFDGLDKNKNPLKMGIYIILLEALNSSDSTLDILKGVVVVAKKL